MKIQPTLTPGPLRKGIKELSRPCRRYSATGRTGAGFAQSLHPTVAVTGTAFLSK